MALRRFVYPLVFAAAFVAIIGMIFAFANRGNDDPIDLSESDVLQAEPSLDAQIAEGRSGARDRIELSDTPVNDKQISRLTEDDDWLETLILDSGIITDAGVETIAQLPALMHLRLRESPVGDDGLRQLANCDALQILNLPQSRVTAAGIASLSDLGHLHHLRLGSPELDRTAGTAVAKLTSLRHLHLIGVPIDDDGLKEIARLPELESLYLDDGDVSEAGWQWLFANRPGIHVHIDQRHPDRTE